MMVSDRPEEPASDDPLEELRRSGLHGEAAARMLVSDARFELPSGDELEQLKILHFERDGFPSKQAIVVALYVDVLFGRRTLQAAVETLRQEATPEVVSVAYIDALELVAAPLTRQGRVRDAVILSKLLLTAAETAYGTGTPPWIAAARPLLQAAAVLPGSSDPELAPVVAEARSLPESLVAAARVADDPDVLSTTLSVVGQYWWQIAKSRGSPDTKLLKLAETCLAEAVSLRDGAEKGRTLATLAQVQRDLVVLGALDSAVVAATARDALLLVDRRDRPLQWMATRGVLRAVAPTDSDYSPVSLRELLELRSTHGEQVACECLNAELSYRKSLARSPDAATLYRALGSHFNSTNVSESGLESLLSTAAHCIDGGVVPCEELSEREAWRAFARTEAFPVDQRLPARLHLALHTTDEGSALSWVVAEANPLLSSNELSESMSAALYASAQIHAGRGASDQSSPHFAFRCYVLSAGLFSELGLLDRARECLGGALETITPWSPTAQESGDPSWLSDHTALQAILDACLRQAAMLDATLGSTMREWLLTVGRTLSWAAYSGPLATPLTAVAHSEAFKGAVTSRLLAAPGPAPDIPNTQQLLLQIAALREQEVEDETVVLPSLAFEELQLCAWLHDREQLGGASATHRRRNLESRYDDLRTRTAVYLRPAWAFGLRELPHELVDEQLDSNAALLDLYLGRDEAGEYCTYASVYFRKTWRRYGTRCAATELTSEVNPIDTTSSLLLDGLAPFIGSLRYHVQEPSAWRPVGRVGAAALAQGSNLILGKLVDDLADLSEAGCEHLVVCPHGPLAFVPFHLLPVQGSPLADDFIVTTVPSLGSMLEYPSGQPQSPAVRLGIVAAPSGGVPFGLPEEPRMASQAAELSSTTADTVSLVGPEATPAATKDLLARCRFAHLVAHGAALGSSPAFHCLFLEDPDGSDPASTPMKFSLRIFGHSIW